MIQTRTHAGVEPAVGAGERWRLGFASLEREFVDEVDLVVNGAVPSDLAGTLFRMGPARHEAYGKRNRYWFEGDGMVHAVRLRDGRAFYRNRFVETAKLREEREAGDAGRGRARTFVREARRLRQPILMFNPANTTPVIHAGQLLALSEQGRPHRLDLETLATIEEDDLGVIPERETFSAHPKLDPATGELWNIGLRFPGPGALLSGPTVRVRLYRRDREGRTQVVASHPLPTPTFTHDIALTPTKVVVAAAPLTAGRLPVRMMLGLDGFIDGLRWDPRTGTRILVIDRTSGDARTYETGPFMIHHTANAFDDGEDVIVDQSPYPDQSVILRMFQDPLAGRWPAAGSMNQCWPERMRLTVDGRVERRKLADVPFEFPRISPAAWLCEHRWMYGVTGYLGAPVALDTETGTVTHLPIGDGEHAGEPVAVPKAGIRSETGIWLLCLVLGERDVTELRIFDGSDLGAPPVARVPLPHVIPFDYHGSWLPAGGQSSLP